MWALLLLIVITLLAIKLVNLQLFWSRQGLPCEPIYRYLYRVLWQFSTRPPFEVIREDIKRYGKVYGSFQGLQPALVVADIEIAKDVLIKQFGSFFKRTFEFTTGDRLWDNALPRLPYEKWKPVRTIMGYTFTSAKMRGMIPKLDKVATRLVEKLTVTSDGQQNELELRQYLQAYSMDSIVAISFGIDLDCIENPDNDFVKHASGLFKPGLASIFLLLCPNLMRYVPFIDFPPRETSKFFGKLARHIVQEKRKNLDTVIRNNKADIIDLHLLAQREDTSKQITDEVLASQAFLFFVGGLDTTVLALEMTTYYLTINPDVQQRVYEEIAEVMGTRTEPTYEHLSRMKLLEASILEALRLVPVTFRLDRICTEDTKVAGIPISKGMQILFPLPYIHIDPEYFPEPERYFPERFLKGGQVCSEMAAFLTFGDGPKSCVGRRLAIMNMQIILAKLLLKLRLDRCDATPVPFEMLPGINFGRISKDRLVVKLVRRA